MLGFVNVVANLDSLLEASCESERLDPSVVYHLVLSSIWNPGPGQLDAKSSSVRPEPANHGSQVRWRKPFGDQM